MGRKRYSTNNMEYRLSCCILLIIKSYNTVGVPLGFDGHICIRWVSCQFLYRKLPKRNLNLCGAQKKKRFLRDLLSRQRHQGDMLLMQEHTFDDHFRGLYLIHKLVGALPWEPIKLQKNFTLLFAECSKTYICYTREASLPMKVSKSHFHN